MAQLDKLNSNSLDTEVQDTLPPKIPPYSKLQDLSGSAGNSTSSCLTPSPAPVLNVNSSACFSSSGIGLGPRQVTSLGVESNEGRTSPLLYPRMSGLHRSLESLPLQMSLAPEPQESEEYKGGENLSRGYTTLESRVKDRHDDSGQPSSWTSGSKVSLTLTDRSVQFYSNRIHNAAHTAYSAKSIPGFRGQPSSSTFWSVEELHQLYSLLRKAEGMWKSFDNLFVLHCSFPPRIEQPGGL